MKSKIQTILITGATSGLGYSFAELYASHGHKLILIGRNTEKLAELKEILPTEVITFSCDFSKQQEYTALGQQLIEQSLIPDTLINNAGFGGMGTFYERSFDEEARMIEVNITALTYFCNLFAPFMKAKSSPTYILNIASAAAFVSGPYQAVYYASKAYVLSYTLAIHDELCSEKSNLFVACFCPGRLQSAFHDRMGTQLNENILSTEKAARIAHSMLTKKKAVHITPFKMRFMAGLLPKILPRFLISFYTIRKNRHFLKNVINQNNLHNK